MTSDIDREARIDATVKWLRSVMDESGARNPVLGLSGGVDSAVVCALCVLAAGPERVIAAILPIHSSGDDAGDAMLVANAFNVRPVVLDLMPAYDALVDELSAASPAEQREVEPDASRLALANIKPRLRMTTLYYLANRYSGLVVGTGNKTEVAIGYFTKYGDGGVDLLPLGDLDKTAVWQLARAMGVPSPIIAKAPSARLWPGQTPRQRGRTDRRARPRRGAGARSIDHLFVGIAPGICRLAPRSTGVDRIL